MSLSRHTKLFVAVCMAVDLLLLTCSSRTAPCRSLKPTSETTNMTVSVKEYDTGEPVSQAHVSLQFGAQVRARVLITD